MNLPPKAISALVDIKRDLLSTKADESVIITHEEKAKVEPRRRTWMRSAPRPNAYQRMCQRGERW